MLSRRELLAGGAVTQLARGDAAAAQRRTDDAERDGADALAGISQSLSEIRSQYLITTPVYNQIRDRQ